ncbi:MAG: ATP/GTP-binding protein [Acidobacteriota bacterium]
MSSPLKIVVAGPVAAGKSTFVRHLSASEVVDTDEVASEAIGKATTTVALDFGALTLDGVTLHLFGSPGQERFGFVWEILCEGAVGLVLLVAGDRPRDLPRARRILEHITSREPVPFVLGVTHQDAPRAWRPDEVADYFQLPAERVVALDARDAASSARVLERLLELLATLEATDPHDAGPHDAGPHDTETLDDSQSSRRPPSPSLTSFGACHEPTR